MILRVTLYLDVPGEEVERVMFSMIEDKEIIGGVEYLRNERIKAKLTVECDKIGTCFSTLEDRLRCLVLIEDLYSVFREKYRARKNQNKPLER